MNIKLQTGDWFNEGGEWFYWSADGSEKVGPFATEEEAKRDLACAAITAMLED